MLYTLCHCPSLHVLFDTRKKCWCFCSMCQRPPFCMYPSILAKHVGASSTSVWHTTLSIYARSGPCLYLILTWCLPNCCAQCGACVYCFNYTRLFICGIEQIQQTDNCVCRSCSVGHVVSCRSCRSRCVMLVTVSCRSRCVMLVKCEYRIACLLTKLLKSACVLQ